VTALLQALGIGSVGQERAAVESAYAALTAAQNAHCGALERVQMARLSFADRSRSIMHLRGAAYNREVRALRADVEIRLTPLEAEAERLGVEREQVRERFYAVRAAWVAAGEP
jgi:hypothetical protein